MIPIQVRTLILSQPPAPSVLVLQPMEEVGSNGVGRIIPIWMGSHEAASIGLALEGIRPPRPVTHDLFLDALSSLDAYVDHCVINDVKGKTFYAQLCLRQHGRLIIIDARPSDAIPLALKQNAPLFVNQDVLDRASFPYILKDKNALTEEDAEAFRSFVEDLEPDDFAYDEVPDNLESVDFGPDDLFIPGRLDELLKGAGQTEEPAAEEDVNASTDEDNPEPPKDEGAGDE